MKHNEIKSYFRKKVQNELQPFGIKVLSVDKSNTSKILYIIDDNNFRTDFVVDCWFTTDTYEVSVYPAKDKINYFKDAILTVKGSYGNLEPLCQVINSLVENYG